MKKAFILGTCLALLTTFTSCTNPIPASSIAATTAATTATSGTAAPIFSAVDLPRIDGSTANIPLCSLMLQRAAGMSAADADVTADKFTTTPNAYLNLVQGKTDLLLAYEADEGTKQSIMDSGVELEYHPIGRDALVFLENAINPVKNLATKQIQDIYQGKITNWKDMGGNDQSIVAYQRAAASGSQALMIKLVMGNLKLMDAPQDLYPAEMGGLIDALGSYNNAGNALGYSVYYYAKNMYNQPGLGFLSVDGVAPSNDTIRDGSYPFVNEFYAVVRKDCDSNTRKLLDWILSDAGKQCVTDAGYVGI